MNLIFLSVFILSSSLVATCSEHSTEDASQKTWIKMTSKGVVSVLIFKTDIQQQHWKYLQITVWKSASTPNQRKPFDASHKQTAEHSNHVQEYEMGVCVANEFLFYEDYKLVMTDHCNSITESYHVIWKSKFALERHFKYSFKMKKFDCNTELFELLKQSELRILSDEKDQKYLAWTGLKTIIYYESTENVADCYFDGKWIERRHLKSANKETLAF